MSDLSVHLDGEASVLQLQLNDYGLNDCGAQRMECGFSLCGVSRSPSSLLDSPLAGRVGLWTLACHITREL